MNNYLAATEIAHLVGCKPNSFSCMRRWLKKNDWPFAVSISGFPTVSRAYHDARMAGLTANTTTLEFEPNMGAFA